MHRGTRNALGRFVLGVPRGRYRSTSAEQTVNPTKPRGDTAFVKRRRVYEKEMHKLRISYANEQAKAESNVEEAKKADLESLEGVAEARAARKRAKSIARQAEHLARLEAVQEKKRERTEYKRRDWEERSGEVLAGRVELADLLAENAEEWVSAKTLDENVDKVVDEFFVVGAQQKHEVEEMLKN